MRTIHIRRLIICAPLLALAWITLKDYFNVGLSDTDQHVLGDISAENLQSPFNLIPRFERDVSDNQAGDLICIQKKPGPIPPTEDTNKPEKIPSTREPLGPHKACCPPNDKGATPYREGSDCCVDKVFSLATGACCKMDGFNKVILKDNSSHRDLCIAGKPFCIEDDLRIEPPMTRRCFSEGGYLTRCIFSCPSGSLPKRGTRDTSCVDGVWIDEKKTRTCEGCNSTFTQDVWIVLQNPNPRLPVKNILRTFLKNVLRYVPVSQDGVRVGITTFGNSVNTVTGVWDMDEHDSWNSAATALDKLPLDGFGNNLEDALTWVARNAFSEERGDRNEVENHVILILESSTRAFTSSPELLAKARVQVVAIGSTANRVSLAKIASDPKYLTFFRHYRALSKNPTILYEKMCKQD